MVNVVHIIGHLGKDPELRYSQTGSPFCSFSMATDESYTDRDGNKNKKTEWHNIVCFGKQAESCANYLAKGSMAFVDGKLQTRQWQDQQGQTRYTTEIVANRVQFLDRKDDQGQQPQQAHQGQQQQQQGQGQQQQNRRPPPRQQEQDDRGPAFPSEAAGMDDHPF